MTDDAKPEADSAGGGIVRFVVEQRVSRFTVQAFAGGVLSAIGHDPAFVARDYIGEIQCNPETGEGASLKLSIKAASLQLNDDMSSKDKKTIEETIQTEVLESAKFPDIVYEATAADTTVKKTGDGSFDVTLNGSLTLHGATRKLPISAKVNAGPQMLKTFGEFAIRQSEYHIKPVSVAGGSLKVKDELKCVFDLVARPATN
ncbi:MAG: YceI family protein [Gemmatimonadaceae bacterium]